ncbi:MAG: hypothetical protein GY772_26385 [bacterium]|nr:hypothetical protein [bacterium]
MTEESKRIAAIKAAAPSPRTQTRVDDLRRERQQLAEEVVFHPEKMAHLYKMCQAMSSIGLCGHKSPESALSAVLFGLGLGMPPMQGLTSIQVIHGRPCLRGPAALAHITSLGHVLRVVTVERGEDPAAVAIVETERDGRRKEFRGTREAVDRAGLPAKNPVWDSYPERCLKWHVVSEATQEVFGDLLAGAYLVEEMEQAPSITPAPEPPPARPSARRPEHHTPRRKQPEVSPWSEEAAKAVIETLPDGPKPALTVGERFDDPISVEERAEIDALPPMEESEPKPAKPPSRTASLDEARERCRELLRKLRIPWEVASKRTAVSAEMTADETRRLLDWLIFAEAEWVELVEGRPLTVGPDQYYLDGFEDGSFGAVFVEHERQPVMVGTFRAPEDAATACLLDRMEKNR